MSSLLTLWNQQIFNPKNYDGLKLWLVASDSSAIISSGSAVSQWSDKSGNGNHATQSTGSLQPTTGVAIQNGKNGIRLNGANRLDSIFQFPSGGYTIFIVARVNIVMSAWNNFPYFIKSNNDNQSLFLRKSSGNLEMKSQAAGSNDPRPIFNWETQNPTGDTAILTSVGQLNSVQVRNNGVELDSRNRTSTASTLTVDISSMIGGDLDGDIFEIIAYEGVLSSAEIAQIESYLNSQWSIY